MLTLIYLWITISHFFACSPTLELITFEQHVCSAKIGYANALSLGTNSCKKRNSATLNSAHLAKKQCNFDSGWLEQQQCSFHSFLWILRNFHGLFWISIGSTLFLGWYDIATSHNVKSTLKQRCVRQLCNLQRCVFQRWIEQC